MKAALGFAILLLTGCTSTLTPEAQRVRVTKKEADVAGCQSLGFVEAPPPHSTPDDAEHELRNRAAALGGNVLFVTSYSLKATGVAYACPNAPTTANP